MTNQIQPMDNIIYNTFVSKFNEEYSTTLNENQRTLLNKYISSFSDNGLEFKFYLNEELGTLKEKLKDSKKTKVITEDESLKNKIDSRPVFPELSSFKYWNKKNVSSLKNSKYLSSIKLNLKS